MLDVDIAATVTFRETKETKSAIHATMVIMNTMHWQSCLLVATPVFVAAPSRSLFHLPGRSDVERTDGPDGEGDTVGMSFWVRVLSSLSSCSNVCIMVCVFFVKVSCPYIKLSYKHTHVKKET